MGLTMDFLKQLKDNGITCTSDGLLISFISRNQYTAACDAINAAIRKRETEIEYLQFLEIDLIEKIGVEPDEEGSIPDSTGEKTH